MKKNATSLSRSGLSDWLIQRVSAYILGVYFVFILAYLLCHGSLVGQGNLDYAAWHGLMTHPAMRIFSLLALLSLAAHAWIGMWMVFTDYVTERQMGPKANALRLALQVGMILVNLVYVVWGIQILWGN